MGRWMKDNWWVALAVVAGLLVTTMGVGLPVEDGTTGALVGGIVIALLGLTMLAGVVVRRRHRVPGDLMIAVGTLPLYWLLWTIVLPLVGLLIMIPAVTDAADSLAVGRVDEPPPPSGDHGPPPPAMRDQVVVALLAATAVAIVAALAVGEQDVAFALVAPPVAILVAHLLVRRARLATLARVGLTGVVASLLHGIATVAMLLGGDPGVVGTGTGPSVVSDTVMGAVGVVGLVLVVVGFVTSRDRARPA